MSPALIIAHRLLHQGLLGGNFESPESLLDHMVAMQSQEFAPARWAIGLRVSGSTDQRITDLFNNGKIVRSHLLRPTWHFILPENIRWVTKLTEPHITRMSRYYHRQQGLDTPLFLKTRKLLTNLLSHKNFMTRQQIEQAFIQHKIVVKGIALGYLMMDAELNCIICSGPRKGNQFTYALVDEICPPAKLPSREESLTILLSQFIRSRGPVSLQDFTYWSGLSLTDAKAGLAGIDKDLYQFSYNEQLHYLFPDQIRSPTTIRELLSKYAARSTLLLPDYDEYLMSYKDKSLLQAMRKNNSKGSFLYNRMIIHHGRIAAEWRKPSNVDEISFNIAPGLHPSARLMSGIKRSSRQYLQFVKN
ncbi:MAG: winged helix DNA-binding domain-containing protein [Chitinophagaceae bacterium]|nr:MAG: winged helix DNA-binding domain-containing protein [Chitinophagaceae bacterium]